jgi:uncharacterized protein HemY
MKKAVHTTPKQRLKEERELRGWSQKYVAEQIEADHYYLSRFLDARGLYAQAEVHLKRAEDAATSAQDGVGLAVVLLNLGKIAERQGDYVQAEALLQEGLVLARQRGDGEQIGHLLMNLGAVATHRSPA